MYSLEFGMADCGTEKSEKVIGMKKRLGSAVALILFLTFAIIINTDTKKAGNDFDFSKWGSVLREDALSRTRDHTGNHNEKEIYVQGKNTVILKEDVKRATAFYQLAGMEKADAKIKAVEYLKEYEAMYAKARELGYSATEQEINSYVEEIKKVFVSSELDKESKDQFKAIMEEFDSEEEYWTYQKEICKKQLPIQKMVSDLEKEYYQNNPGAGENEWELYFESYKKRVAEEEYNGDTKERRGKDDGA